MSQGHRGIVPPPLTEDHRKLMHQVEELAKWRNTMLPEGFNENMRILASMVKYVCDVDLANYTMSNKHKLGMAMLLEGVHWRAHQKQIFHYEEGAWSWYPLSTSRRGMN